jgi:hypothetical protein
LKIDPPRPSARAASSMFWTAGKWLPPGLECLSRSPHTMTISGTVASECARSFTLRIDKRCMRGSASIASSVWYGANASFHARSLHSCIFVLGSSSVTTTKRQSCALCPVGARIAASMSWKMMSSGTGSGLKRRSARDV